MTTIVLWLSANFGLPAIQDHPNIERVPFAKIMELRYKGLAVAQPVLPSQTGAPREPVAVYGDEKKTIYLRDDWTGSTPAEVSILVHEMVHHLQSSGNLSFECPQEREQLAYKAQDKWLSLFGTDLAKEFDIDAFTVLVSSRCGY